MHKYTFFVIRKAGGTIALDTLLRAADDFCRVVAAPRRGKQLSYAIIYLRVS
jgi:hypothetical protein